jgi:hypothetical protein
LNYEYVANSGASQQTHSGVRCVSYVTRILDANQDERFGYHWHPSGASRVNYPHIHVTVDAGVGPANDPLYHRPLSDLHIITGIVTLEHIVRFLIEELDIQPRTDDWPTILETNSALARHDFPDED